MTPVILFRPHIHHENEFGYAKRHFPVVTQRAHVPPGSLVIGRYSCLPYYKELEADLAYSHSALVNTYRQHRYIADLANWYQDLEGLTPKTWFHLHEIPEGEFVLKGETNSKKFQWGTHMFASSRAAAGEVYSRLQADGLVGEQRVCIREYVPLRTFTIDAGGRGLPITEEYRFFVLDGHVLSGGFYWSSHYELAEDPTNGIDPDNVPREFLADVCARVGANARFYVVDVARTADGKWIVVELNDGQMSGLSENNPEVLYSALSARLRQ